MFSLHIAILHVISFILWLLCILLSFFFFEGRHTLISTSKQTAAVVCKLSVSILSFYFIDHINIIVDNDNNDNTNTNNTNTSTKHNSNTNHNMITIIIIVIIIIIIIITITIIIIVIILTPASSPRGGAARPASRASI